MGQKYFINKSDECIAKDVVGENSLCTVYSASVNSHNGALAVLNDISRKGDFLELYQNFLKTKQLKKSTADFIILNQDNAVWCPEPDFVSVETISREFHKDKPVKKLYTILKAVREFSETLYAVHANNFVCGSITGSTFGFKKRSDNIISSTVILAHVCSLHPASDPADIKKDIYDTGALIFKTITGDDYADSPSNYKNIKNMVNESALLKSSENTNHPKVRGKITEILKKSLAADNAEQFDSCKEMTALLDDVIEMLKTASDKNKNRNSDFTFEYQLFNNPIYQYHKENMIHVLVIGLGGYGSAFTDICLQQGQIPGYKLKVSAFSNDMSDFDIYLADRPALKDFFHTKGHATMPDSLGCYGSISFSRAEFSKKDYAENKELARTILKENPDICYTFIATGTDWLNYEIAKNFSEISAELGTKQNICYVQEYDIRNISGAFPLCVNKSMKGSQLAADIERMAFNAHLLWESDLNLDFAEAYKNFKNKYNYNSNIRLVLAMKSKLFAIGINFKEGEYHKAAEEFVRLMNKKEIKNELRINLIWAEHKRWVTEKLVDGWERLEDLNKCPVGDTKLKKEKKHICIVKSRPDYKLACSEKEKAQKWDKLSDKNYALLDPLDKLSIDFHRRYMHLAKENNNMIQRQLLDKIEEALKGSTQSLDELPDNNRKALNASQEWKACVDDIIQLNSSNSELYNRNSIKLYNSYKKALLKAAESLDAQLCDFITSNVEAFDNSFKYQKERLAYRDFKDNDALTVDRIPFILTYSRDIHLAIPFADSDNTNVFRNIASASVINPANITYIYITQNPELPESFGSALSSIINYAEKRHIRSALNFLIICTAPKNDTTKDNIEKTFRSFNSSQIKKVKTVFIDSVSKISGAVENHFRKNNIAFEKNETNLSYFLLGSGLYEKYPSYTFELNTKKFITDDSCRYLSYIKSNQYLKIEEMIAFNCSNRVITKNPDYCSSFQEIWNIYKGRKSTWDRICKQVQKYICPQCIAAIDTNAAGEETEFSYALPAAIIENVKKVLRDLKNLDAISQGSVSQPNNNIFTVTVCCKQNYQEPIMKTLNTIRDSIGSPDDIIIHKKDSKIIIRLSPSSVSMKISDSTPNALIDSDIIQMLKDLSKQELCIQDLKINDTPNRVDFRFKGDLSKELLSVEGKMLEVFIYQKIKNSGEFNDVVGSCKLSWLDTGVENEFDCIVTKDFRTFLIECKAQAKLEQDYFYKLSCLADHFGINVQPILVAFAGNGVSVKGVQNAQRAAMMKNTKVITIANPDDVNNITNTLKSIIKGNYDPIYSD